MDIREIIRQTWPEWTLVRPLGSGSYGSVFMARRTDAVGNTDAAIKVIAIPRDEAERKQLRMEGMNTAEMSEYCEKQVQAFTAEIRLMESVKGYTNIVFIEDYKVVSMPEVPQWYLLIRMELLTPLVQRVSDRPMTEPEVVRLGIDLCTALTVCRKKSIVHRDIKPENIFLNAAGDFKLGDFGVARTLESATVGFTRTGTYNYMAPELFNGTLKRMDIESAAKVDIYSLGMVLHTLMNNGRMPFLPTDRTPSPADRTEAISRRMQGETLPAPINASGALSEIILRACAFNPEDRYATADAMKRDLQRLQLPSEDDDSIWQVGTAAGGTVRMEGADFGIPTGRADAPAWNRHGAKASAMDDERPGPARTRAAVYPDARQDAASQAGPAGRADSDVPRERPDARRDAGRPAQPPEEKRRRGGTAIVIGVMAIVIAALIGVIGVNLLKDTSPETPIPTATPTVEAFTAAPTEEPTATPTVEPTPAPTDVPTATPTIEPTPTPTEAPTATPTVEPTEAPTATPSAEPTSAASISIEDYRLYGGVWQVTSVFDVDGIQNMPEAVGLGGVFLSLGQDGGAILSQVDGGRYEGTWRVEGEAILVELPTFYNLTLSGVENVLFCQDEAMKQTWCLQRVSGPVATIGEAGEAGESAQEAEAAALAPEPTPYVFKEPKIEQAARDALGKPTGDLYPEELAGITELHLSDSGLDDISDLYIFTGLQELWLENNQISDLSPLAGLSGLQELYLYDNQISDLSPLAGLSGLQALSLAGNQISDLSPLAGLAGLQYLLLGDNQISDLSPLAGLSRLQELSLNSNQISDVSPLAGLSGMQDLRLTYNQISDLSPLAGLSGLQVLVLAGNHISDLSPLAGLSGLQRLSLGKNQISDVSPLAGLTGLQELMLDNNQISDVSPLAGLKQLEYLYLEDNKISDLSPLAGLSGLQILYLRGNQISDLSPLAGLTGLQSLSLNNNPISDIFPVTFVPNLTY